MKRMLFLLTMGLVYGVSASKVCFDKTVSVEHYGLAPINQSPNRCPANFTEASGDLDLLTRIGLTRESPMTGDILITCCRDKAAGEIIPQGYRLPGKLPMFALGNQYEVS